MKRKYKIMIAVIIGILFVGYNFVVIKLNQELNMFKTEEQILGTFITEDNTLVDAQYFVVDQSEKAYWYQQQGFYEEGTIERLNTGNVYKASFEEKDKMLYSLRNRKGFKTRWNKKKRTKTSYQFIAFLPFGNLHSKRDTEDLDR